MSLESLLPAAEPLKIGRRPQSRDPDQPSWVLTMDRRGLRGRHVGKACPEQSRTGSGKWGDLSWRVKKTQPAVQLRRRRRLRGPRQESEALVVAMIPCRTSGPGNSRRSEGTPLVPQARSAGKDVVTAREG